MFQYFALALPGEGRPGRPNRPRSYRLRIVILTETVTITTISGKRPRWLCTEDPP